MQHALLWIKSDGVEQYPHKSLAAGPATYYAEVSKSLLGSHFSVTLKWDATAVVTFTIEATDDKDATSFAAVGSSGWVAKPGYGSVVVPGGSASSDTFEISGATATRYRVKAGVTTAGVITGTTGSGV
jgi:hypothetical protein